MARCTGPRNSCCAGTSRLLWVLSGRLWSQSPFTLCLRSSGVTRDTLIEPVGFRSRGILVALCCPRLRGSNSTSVTCWVTSASFPEVPWLPFTPLCKMLIVPGRDLVKFQITETLCINVLLQSQHSTSYLFLLYIFPVSL